MSSADPYTQKAESKAEGLTPQQKIDGLKEILKTTKYGMLTTRSPTGELHSRAMAPASTESLWFTFIANNATFKFDEIEADSNVNVSFLEPSSTSWISVTGKARISNDKELIKKIWSPMVSAWFGDLGDGIHKGDENDPRVSVIQVVPDEIRYWYASRSKVGQMAEIVTSAITGGTAAPGELRTITKAEIQLVEGLNTV